MEERYDDLEKLLYRGFLTSPVKIGGLRLVLKSLNAQEFDLVQDRLDSVPDYMYDGYMLAASTYMAAGVNNLVLGEERIHVLSDAFRWLPLKVRRVLLSVIRGLNAKAAAALKYLESYLYESGSRQQWLVRRGTPLCSSSLTGIPGTDTLGLNGAQMTWQTFNLLEDDRVSDDRRWDTMAFVASASDPKGVRKVISMVNSRRKHEEERREKVRLTGSSEEPDQIMIRADTVEDLQEQMRKWVQGEEDFHDQIITAYKNQIRSQFQAQAEKRQQALLGGDEAGVWGDESSAVSAQGFTPDEVARHVGEKRGYTGINFEGEKAQSVFNKMLRNEPAFVPFGDKSAPAFADHIERVEPDLAAPEFTANLPDEVRGKFLAELESQMKGKD